MKKIFIILLLLPAAIVLKAQIAIKAEMIYTVSGAAIPNGVVLVKNGKIENYYDSSNRQQVRNRSHQS